MRVGESFAESNVGRKRRHNEDSYVASPPLFVVADGMGGAQAGEVASALAAGTVRELDQDPGATGLEQVVALIKAANLRVHARATADASASGMGTTMTAAILQEDGKVAIGHVGDSRAYRLRAGRLEQLTDDHSLVAELVRRGELSPEEAAVHPQRSVITRALGTEPDVEVDAFTVEAQDGDLFLLCSDGLTTMLDSQAIADIIERHRQRLDVAIHSLIKAANDRGGDDNITAILFAVADGDGDLTGELLPLAPAAAAPGPDIEDTLHPEDGVRLPPDATVIVPASAVADALAADGLAGPNDAHAADQGAAPGPAPAEQVSVPRLVLACLVIVALTAAIVLLVFDALPR